MRSRTFLNVSLGILALAAAYHLGATSATAQAPGNPVVGITEGDGVLLAITTNGDTYTNNCGICDNWAFRSNVFSGGATPVQQTTFGELKARYRGEREP